MTRIVVKNGDWDAARAELGTVLDKNKATFDAQFAAAFGSNRKPAAAAEPAAKAAPVPAAGKLVLSRSRRA